MTYIAYLHIRYHHKDDDQAHTTMERFTINGIPPKQKEN